MSGKITRQIAIVASAALVLGAFIAPPADAAKKKKKKPPAPAACAAYTSPAWATGAQTTVLTDAATEAAPVTVKITTEPGLGTTDSSKPGGGTGHVTHKYHSVLVDTASASAKLTARLEFLQAWDYDLFLRSPDGAGLAFEGDFNPATANGPTPVGTYSGGSAGPGWSQVDEFLSPDCAGYTYEISSGIAGGGEVTLKLWLSQ